MMARTLIKNGTVVSPTGRHEVDVLIEGETILALLERGKSDSLNITADKVIDATGKFVVPGGIDVHTHMELPFGGTNASDTFETGTTAAAWGGVTTIVDFAVQRYGENVQESLATWHKKAAGNCSIDYAFHQIIGGIDEQALADMDYLVKNEGITSFKLFMAYPGVFYSDDGQILRAMQYHSYSRPSLLEGEATNRAIVLSKVAGNVPLYIVHMSASEALNALSEARHEGLNVFGETCPQYLYMTLEDHLAQPGFEGAKYVCSPPIRSKHDKHNHHADLWKGLRMNELAVVSTDHCPFCMKDQKELGIGNFSKIPNGMGSVEHRMELIYQGVVQGEITLERWVETCSTSPARMFGMYPQKGIIAPGSDADILVWDPNGKTKIGVNDKHHMNMDHSSWEGFKVDGKVDTVLSRGKVVVEKDKFTGTKGHGKYIKRGLCQYLN
jgi:dihydropyrimidinase